jgi:hypothetical protein
VSNIALAHYVFQLFENGVLDSEPYRPTNWMENADLGVADLPRRVGQAVPGPREFGMVCDTAQIKLVIEDDARERDQTVLRLYECDVHFRYLHRHHLLRCRSGRSR